MDDDRYSCDYDSGQTELQPKRMDTVPEEQKVAYRTSILRGVSGMVIGFFIPVVGLVFSIAALISCGKYDEKFNTKPARIAAVAGIVVSIIRGIMIAAHYTHYIRMMMG